MMSFGGCNPDKIEIASANHNFQFNCQGNDRASNSSYFSESTLTDQVSWFVFKIDDQDGKYLKFLYNSGAFSNRAKISLSPNGEAGLFIINEKTDLGNGKAIYKINQERETYNGVYNSNSVSDLNQNGDFRIVIEECLNTFNIGDSLKIEILER